MAHQSVDWILQRRYGVPHVDGYGSQVVTFQSDAQEINLGRNCLYRMDILHQDAYWSVLDGYDGTALTYHALPSDAESSVTDATGVYSAKGSTEWITTHTKRHVLSIKAPAGRDANPGEVRIIKYEPGKALKDSDNSA